MNGPPPALYVNSRVSVPADELRMAFSRSGGPGGQGVNKVESRVTLRFDVGRSRALSPEQQALVRARLRTKVTMEDEIVIHASVYRDRHRNIADARQRLAEMLAGALATRATRRPTKPTRGSTRRRLESKRRRAKTKLDRRGDD